MLERLSMAPSTSGGTLMFSTMKLPSSMPYFSVRIGFRSGRSASPNSEYRAAKSSTGTLALATASLKALTNRDRMVS